MAIGKTNNGLVKKKIPGNAAQNPPHFLGEDYNLADPTSTNPLNNHSDMEFRVERHRVCNELKETIERLPIKHRKI